MGNNDEMNEELDSTLITLTDEDGEEFEAEFLDLIELDGKSYAILLPTDEEDDEVVILEVQESDDPEVDMFCGVEEEEILEQVFEIFKQRNLDDFDFS